MLARFSLGEQRIIALLALVVGVAAIGLLSPDAADTADVDHRAHQRTLELMDRGDPYHAAMSQAMVERDGGPAGSLRAFRLPTVFWIWQLLPDPHLAYLVILVLVGGLLVALLPRPLIVPILAVYLASNAFPQLADRGWHAQWLTVELWAVLAVLSSVALWWRGHDTAAAAAALIAGVLREHAGLLVLGGLLAAWRARRPTMPWLLALAGYWSFVAWHWSQAAAFVADVGHEQPLILDGGISSIARMAGFGLPVPLLLGPVLMGTALWRSRRQWLLLPLLLLPLSGLVVLRSYWGLLFVPLALLAAVSPEPTPAPPETTAPDS